MFLDFNFIDLFKSSLQKKKKKSVPNMGISLYTNLIVLDIFS